MRKENWVCSTFRDIFVDASDYQYDLQNRLTEINIQGLPVFGKDLLKQTIQMEYDERGNLIKTTSGNSVLSQYTFDTANRLSETTNVLGIKTNFIYDGAGRRVKMQIDLPKPNIRSIFKPGLSSMFNAKNQANEKETCSWLYNGKDYKLEYNYALDITEPYENVLMIYGKGIDTQRYTYGLDVLSLDTWNKSVSTWSQNSVNGITSKKTDRGYYLQDELGSPVRIVGEAGNTKAIYSYDAFGRPIIPVNLISQCKTRGNIYSYTGYQYDLSTGLMYAQARYYLPEVGRFISEDAYKGKVSDPQSLNLYSYCSNNPINFCDPRGNEDIVVSGGVYSRNSAHNGYKYNFIEPALKKINELRRANKDESITWIIANEGWSEVDWENFSKAIKNLNNVQIKRINNTDDLIDYINYKTGGDSRSKDQISDFVVFAHGFEGQIALGYDYNNYSYNKDLNFVTSDIDKILSNAFSNYPISKFYTCNTATGGCDSFANTWYNKSEGYLSAFEGKTTYRYIMFPEEYGGIFNKTQRFLGISPWNDYKKLVQDLRKDYGFSKFGSIYYPEASEDAKLVQYNIFISIPSLS